MKKKLLLSLISVWLLSVTTWGGTVTSADRYAGTPEMSETSDDRIHIYGCRHCGNIVQITAESLPDVFCCGERMIYLGYYY